MENNNIISKEKLMRYVSGQASVEEMVEVALAISKDPSIKELVDIMEKMNDNGSLLESHDLPMDGCAGMAEGNLCDILCERFILKDFMDEKDWGQIEPEVANIWLKESGTPLHAMGRLLENNGVKVTRKYDCTADDIICCIRERRKAIAVVDSGELWSGTENGIFHAVVCLNIIPGTIVVYDPAKDGDVLLKVHDPAAGANINYEFARFLKAWQHSHNYLVIASMEGIEYHPHPVDVHSVELDDDLMELSEAIAEDAHDIWAARRISEGWTYGPTRDDIAKKHPDLLPYSDLPESEKDYDRESTMHTLRLIKKLGFDIHRRYALYCPECGEFVSEDTNFCPNCGKKLNWENLK